MTHTMTRTTRLVNLGAVVVPFLATLAAIVLFWNRIVSPADLAILTAMYLLTATGITVGYHRMLTHRSFRTHKPTEYAFAALGSMAVQGSVIAWVADHRKHHAHADQEGDPHSPHVGHGDGAAAVLRGLWHAHAGWLLSTQGQADAKRYARDLYEDRGMRLINRRFPLFVLLSLALPAFAGWALTGTLAGAATGLLWGGLVRIFLVHHVTWSVNSVCHFLGTRRFQIEDESTNVAWLALPSFGEAWHHNHHAFPRSAAHGLRWWELDPSAWVIRGLEKLHLARGVVRISPERQRQRLAGAGYTTAQGSTRRPVTSPSSTYGSEAANASTSDGSWTSKTISAP
jgi:stearoyl-CoA desaturase (Delta-9 desaturase)